MPKITSYVDLIPLTNAQLRQAWIRPDGTDVRSLLIEIKRQQLVFEELLRLHAMVFNACHKAGLEIGAVHSIRTVLTGEVDEETKRRRIEEKKRQQAAEASDKRRGNGMPDSGH